MPLHSCELDPYVCISMDRFLDTVHFSKGIFRLVRDAWDRCKQNYTKRWRWSFCKVCSHFTAILCCRVKVNDGISCHVDSIFSVNWLCVISSKKVTDRSRVFFWIACCSKHGWLDNHFWLGWNHNNFLVNEHQMDLAISKMDPSGSVNRVSSNKSWAGLGCTRPYTIIYGGCDVMENFLIFHFLLLIDIQSECNSKCLSFFH